MIDQAAKFKGNVYIFSQPGDLWVMEADSGSVGQKEQAQYMIVQHHTICSSSFLISPSQKHTFTLTL